MRTTRTCVALLVAATLAACGKEDESKTLKSKAIAAIAEAKTQSDPWEAFAIIHRKVLDQGRRCERSFWTGLTSCDNVPEDLSKRAIADADQYLLAALNKGDPRAVSSTMAIVNGDRWESSDQRRQAEALLPILLAKAEQARGTAQDAELLHTAGLLIRDGKYAVRDTRKSVAYLARAWAAGRAQAANDAAMLFASINDQHNAYLWSLRCVGQCYRSGKVELSALQALLSADAARQAEAAANNRSVVELDTRS